MAQTTNHIDRRKDLKRAISRAKPGDMLALEDLALAWGVTKPAFVNIRNKMRMTIEFPDPVKGPGNSHVYPAKAALEAMLAWETRDDQVSAERSKLASRILGISRTRRADPNAAMHSPKELIELNRLAAEIEAREREQGLWIHRDDVSATTGTIFSIFSEVLSNLENEIDPNGRLSADIRKTINEAGRKRLLEIHQQFKVLLDADNTGTRKPARGSGGRKVRG